MQENILNITELEVDIITEEEIEDISLNTVKETKEFKKIEFERKIEEKVQRFISRFFDFSRKEQQKILNAINPIKMGSFEDSENDFPGIIISK